MILFLPWILLSGAYLLARALRRRVHHPHSAVRASHTDAYGLAIVGLGLLLMAAPVAPAEPAIEGHPSCPASTGEEHSLGDRLLEQGNYRAAGECYLAAGDYDRADRAFVRAVGPASAAVARQMSDQGHQAKALLRKVQLAFRPDR